MKLRELEGYRLKLLRDVCSYVIICHWDKRFSKLLHGVFTFMIYDAVLIMIIWEFV